MATASFWETNIGKTIKAGAYVTASATVSYLVTATTNDPALFGSVTVLINMFLVLIQKTWLDSSTPNVGS